MTTLISPLRRATEVGRASIAVRCRATQLTYNETFDRCRRLVGALQALGLERGDRVAVVSPNCHRYLELYQAVPGAGFRIVPLNPRLSVTELRYALSDSGAKVLFTAIGEQGLTDLVEHVIDLGDGYESLLGSAKPAEFPEDLSGNEIAGLFYTGGTTGLAKGVMLTHQNLLANAMHFSMCWPFTSDTRWLVVAPMFHLAGSIAVLPTVWNAGQNVLLPSFNPASALDVIEERAITATLVVPTMLAAM